MEPADRITMHLAHGGIQVPDESLREQRDDQDERIPWQQMLLDDVFLLIMAGLVVPTLFYLVWGLWSLSNVPQFIP